MKKRNLIVKESKPAVLITTATLQAVRERSLEQHNMINQTIDELNDLASEINATLAFLKARRGW